jgi:nicotinate-nucleotide adenylyltransferase
LIDPKTPQTDAPGTPNGVLVFGGAFDPPHTTHRRVLGAALDQLPVDRALVLPAGRHPWKGDRIIASDDGRIDLCQRAFCDRPEVTVSDLELRRAGVGYTVDTLAELTLEFPGRCLYFLIGSDNLHVLDQWHEHHRVLELATIVTYPRSGFPIERGVLAAQDLTATEIDELLAFTIEAAADQVSATSIREALGRGETPAELTPRVADRIRELGLYRS